MSHPASAYNLPVCPERLAQELFIATFANPTLPPHKDEKHLQIHIKQCITAAKLFEKEWKDAN